MYLTDPARTSICDGLPFSSALDISPAEMEASLQLINNPRLVTRYRLHRLQMNAITTITQHYNLQEAGRCKGISALVKVFDTQLQEIDASITDATRMYLSANGRRLITIPYNSTHGSQVFPALPTHLPSVQSRPQRSSPRRSMFVRSMYRDLGFSC